MEEDRRQEDAYEEEESWGVIRGLKLVERRVFLLPGFSLRSRANESGSRRGKLDSLRRVSITAY